MVIRFESKHHSRRSFLWNCQCDCGNSKLILGENLTKTKGTKSCGCLAVETQIKTTHGQSNNRTYKSWNCMLMRCNNQNDIHYKDYGARGIKVCKKWLTFEGFYEDMGDRPKDMTLHRMNNNGNYCKENCKWATAKEQARNRRDSHFINYNNVTKTLSEWAYDMNLPINTLLNRLNRGWSIEKSLNT